MAVIQPKQPMKPGAAATPGPTVRKLNKGDLLFQEGEMSRSMYFLKSGMIRIFKKKGDAFIEIDTIRSGQILGELAFLDGQARSASGEAMTSCELIEISGNVFLQTLGVMPDWLKLLLKTVVGRLRGASTKIKQLEQASTAVDYGGDGRRSQHYVFLSPYDAIKICSAILLVGSHYGKPTEDKNGVTCKVGMINRYGNQIFGLPLAKIQAALDLLQEQGALTYEGTDLTSIVTIKNIDFIEEYVAFQNEENLLEEKKRHDVSIKAFGIMTYMAKHLHKYPKGADGVVKVNLAEIKKTETIDGKEPFTFDDFPELVKSAGCGQLGVRNNDEAYTEVNAEAFQKAFRLQRFIKAMQTANDQKAPAQKGAAKDGKKAA